MELAQKYEIMKHLARTQKYGNALPHDVNLHMSETIGMCMLVDRNGDISVLELQKELRVNKSAISQMLTALENKGYITRTVNPVDRRRIDIGVTSQGYAATQTWKRYLELALNEVFGRFGEEKADQLLVLYADLIAIFNEVHTELQEKFRLENME